MAFSIFVEGNTAVVTKKTIFNFSGSVDQTFRSSEELVTVICISVTSKLDYNTITWNDPEDSPQMIEQAQIKPYMERAKKST